MARTTLFEGIKFWLSRRIPMYTTFYEDIKKHGGDVVPLERLADMLIVDHVRKDNHLPNSYSYRFIELSVKKGALENRSDHLIQTQTASTRPVGNFNSHVRSTRTPFTKADDDYLVNFLSKTNLALQGDKAFFELEKQNNRHTWQSWRSRWVKRLQHRLTLPTAPSSSNLEPVEDLDQAAPTMPNGNDQRSVSATPITSNGRPSNSGVKRDAPTSSAQADSLRSLVQQLETRGEQKNTATQRSTQSPRNLHRDSPTKDQISTMSRGPLAVRNASAPKPTGSQASHHGRDLAIGSSQPQIRSSISTTEQLVKAPSLTSKRGVQAALVPPAGSSQGRSSHEVLNHLASHARGNTTMHGISRNKANGESVLSRQQSYAAPDDQKHMSKVPSSSRLDKLVHQGQLAKARSPSQTRGDSAATTKRVPGSLKAADRVDVNYTGNGHTGDDEVVYPQITNPDDEGKVTKPRLASVHGHRLQPSKLDLFALDETLATNIWRELLLQAEGSNSGISEETVTLTANAGIIRALKDEDFQAAWNLWWRTNPEKPDDEWAAHFNSFCIPFYKAHEEEFEALYEQRLSDIQGATREARVVIPTIAVPPGSPELGSRESPRPVYDDTRTKSTYQRHQIGSPELGDETYGKPNIQVARQPRSQPYDETAESAGITPSRKRSRPSSEVPESPQTPADSSRLKSSKRRRSKEYNKTNSANLLSSRAQQKAHIPDPGLKSQYSNNHASDDLSDSKVQASIDRQLLLEVEEAKESEKAVGPRKDSFLAVTSAPKNQQTVKVRHDTAAGLRRTKSPSRKVEESLFVSDESRSASPMNLPQPETQLPSIDPINVGPFHEGSELGVPEDFEDLVSQLPERLESPSFSQPTTPTEAEYHNQKPRVQAQSHVTEDMTDLGKEGESTEEWIDHQLQEGHDEDVVMLVLHASMLDIGLARKALLYHRKFHRLPNTKPGIWTEEDDGMLLKHSRKGKRDLTEKHGREALEKRRKYLAKLNLAS